MNKRLLARQVKESKILFSKNFFITVSNIFSTAIQGKGINVNGMADQKKLILTKLFKGQKAGPPGSAGSYVPVASSFNE